MSVSQKATLISARVFHTSGQHIAIVIGKKASFSSQIEIVKLIGKPCQPAFALRYAPEGLIGQTHGQENNINENQKDVFYIVKPISSGPPVANIRLEHAQGATVIEVEKLGRNLENLEVNATAIGFSQNFSFDEAFQDAIAHVKFPAQRVNSNRITLVDVVSMGALYGGFSGFSRMFVRLQRTDLETAGLGKILKSGQLRAK